MHSENHRNFTASIVILSGFIYHGNSPITGSLGTLLYAVSLN